jgi:hypothetical protein
MLHSGFACYEICRDSFSCDASAKRRRQNADDSNQAHRNSGNCENYSAPRAGYEVEANYG